MKTRLFVGSIPYSVTELQLKDFFEKVGQVVYVKIIKNKETELSRGFGFVEMASAEEAKAALRLKQSKLEDRTLSIKEAWDNPNFVKENTTKKAKNEVQA